MEEEAATHLEAFEQDLARRREALEAELKAFEQDVPRRREALKARLDAEKRELNEAFGDGEAGVRRREATAGVLPPEAVRRRMSRGGEGGKWRSVRSMYERCG